MDQEKLAGDLATIKANISEIHTNVQKILIAIYGDKGLVVQTALNKSSIRRIWGIVLFLTSVITGAMTKFFFS